MKLDRLLAHHRSMGRNAAKRAIAAGRVSLNGQRSLDGHAQTDRFCTVCLDEEIVQQGQRALYLMMHKPVGLLSATKDAKHPTVLDAITDPDKESLHLAGRLDRSTSGLLLLTNDGRWSKQLMAADFKVPKVYRVELDRDPAADAVEAFARGFHFHTENITTLPARLELLAPRLARVTLHEGRYHQIKRMFHRVGCRVTALHRQQVGQLCLPQDLHPGQWRPMTPDETALALLGSAAPIGN